MVAFHWPVLQRRRKATPADLNVAKKQQLGPTKI